MAADAWDRASPEARAEAMERARDVRRAAFADAYMETSDALDDHFARTLFDAEERGREAGREEVIEKIAQEFDRRGGLWGSDVVRSFARQRAQQPPQLAPDGVTERYERMISETRARLCLDEYRMLGSDETLRCSLPKDGHVRHITESGDHWWERHSGAVIHSKTQPEPENSLDVHALCAALVEARNQIKLLTDALEAARGFALLRSGPARLLLPQLDAALKAVGREPR